MGTSADDTKKTEADRHVAELNPDIQRRLLGDAGHYWPPEALPFAYALGCIQIVLLNGKVDKPYIEAKEAWGLPDCKMAAAEMKIQLIKDATNVGIPNKQYQPPNLLDYRKYNNSADFQHLIMCQGEFILKGFNRQPDYDNEKWQVVPNVDAPLFGAVIVWTLGDYLGIKLEDWNKYKPLEKHGEIIDTEETMSKDFDRTKHKILSILKQSGNLINDQTILETAEMWYKAKVEFSTIAEATSYYGLKDPTDLSHRIQPCNDATGWKQYQ